MCCPRAANIFFVERRWKLGDFGSAWTGCHSIPTQLIDGSLAEYHFPFARALHRAAGVSTASEKTPEFVRAVNVDIFSLCVVAVQLLGLYLLLFAGLL